MFGRLPEARPGELLYSVLARWGRYLQAGEAAPLMRTLLNRRWAIASVDLPGHLSELVRDLPDADREITIDRLIDSGTLLPFHTAFMPEDVQNESRAAMRGDVTGLYTRLGLAAFKVRPPTNLRFCPACLDEMEVDHGDLWWRRDHQLPGIVACPTHGVALRLSDVQTGDLNRHAFVPASRSVCRQDAASAADGLASDDLERMVMLAGAAADILVDPPAGRDYADTAADYRSRLGECGLMRSPKKVDHASLVSAFRDCWGGMPEAIPGLALAEDHETSWLSALVRSGRRAAHPLQHLMLRIMLDGRSGKAVPAPFGTGPWECRNPLADHHGEAVVQTVVLRRGRGRSLGLTFGDFACTCGYLYTRSCDADGVVGEPRFRRFGPLLAPALRDAVERSESLRGIAGRVGLDPKTLMREAAIAGVEVTWSTKPSGSVPKAALPITKSGRPKRRNRRALRNWFAIDTRLARSVRTSASVMLSELPPRRITVAALERRAVRRDWVQKRRTKLPQTVAALAAAVETTSAFRERRLHWCVSMAFAAGDLRPCEILRAAGLPMSWLPKVEQAVVGIQIHRSAAA